MRKRISALLGLLLISNAHAAGELYCCQDPGTGRRSCGDTLPEPCRGRAHRIFDRAGNLIQEVGPTLTAEQKAEQLLENKRRKAQDEANREQRRRDRALLDTYAMPEDIDLAQKKAESDVNAAIAATIARIETARGKRVKFANEAEFYKKKSLPPELEKELRSIDHDIKVHQELLEIKKKDFEAIKAKYDADRKRYFELTRRPGHPSTDRGGETAKP